MLDTNNLSLVERDKALASEFHNLKTWEEKYGRLIEIGKNATGLTDLQKIDDLKVQGCQSQVWLKAELDSMGRVQFLADSDALITKGLVCLLVLFFNNLTPDEIIQAQPKFIEDIGLRSHLSPSRANGLLSMIKQIKFYGMAFKIKAASLNK